MKKMVRRKNPQKILDEAAKEPVKKVPRIFYKPQRCIHVNEDGSKCPNRAVGRGTICAVHGGQRRVEEILIPPESNLIPILSQKYNPVIHPLNFIDLSRQGLSMVEIAARFQVSVDAIRKWADKYLEMAKAVEIGNAMHESWWLQQGKDNLDNRFFQTGLFKFLTGNKLGYSEKIETKNLNQNTYGVLLVPGSVTVDEWEQENIRRDKLEQGEVIDVTPE